MIVNVNGDIVSNDEKWFYDWFGYEAFCPKDLRKAIDSLPEGEKLEIKINSGGGSVFAGKEIYSLLRKRNDVDIEIESIAASAASLIAMAGHCSISPAGTVMIHRVSATSAAGNTEDMAHLSEVLQDQDESLAAAYAEKTGKPKDEILALMAKETWLNAEKALEYGFVDEITARPEAAMVASCQGSRITDEMRQQAIAAREKQDADKQKKRAEEITNDLFLFGI